MDLFPKQKEQKEIFITASVFVLAVISFEIDDIVFPLVIVGSDIKIWHNLNGNMIRQSPVLNSQAISLAWLFKTTVSTPGG